MHTGTGCIYTTHSFEMASDEKRYAKSPVTKTLHKQKVVIKYYNNDSKNRIELQPPVRNQADHIYKITFKSDNVSKNLSTRKTDIPDAPVQMAPGIRISFPQDDHEYVDYLISQMYFKFP